MKLIYCIILLLGLATVPEISKQRLAVREVAAKAVAGDPKALYDLAMLHDMGYDSIPVDSVRSTLLYRLSAEAGYAPAQNYLGFRYFNGEAVHQDVDSALYWMAKAAGNGDAKAANNLGYLLANSEKVTRDYPQAIYWLTKAADAGLPAGMSQLADLYRMGHGCTPDTARAEALYTRAIQAGLHDAELKLLAMKGNQWLALSPDSALSLGKYHYSHGAPVIAVTLFENVASYKDNECPPTSEKEVSTDEVNQTAAQAISSNCVVYNAATKALALLGDAYSRGLGVEYDHDRSVALFYEAALRGDPSAEFVIAELLDIFPDALDAITPTQDINLNHASSNPPQTIHHPNPSNITSTSSNNSDIDPSQLTNAAYWYERAAAQGITDAATATTRLLE
ncbi:MAG: sel1 repeat family protein [Muribaculaceae bacterium]|nr:sel1 repeat family protein [Muribaculaceae bacterium]